MGLLKTLRRRLGRDRLHLVEGHGIAVVAAEAEAGIDPAFGRIDQRDRKTLGIAGDDRDVLCGFRKRHAAGLAGQAAIGIERDAVLRACGRDRHFAVGRGDFRLRQQPAGEHGFGQRYRDGKTPGGAENGKAFGKARTRTVAILRHPGQRQAGLGQRLPERGLPRAVLVAIDGLGVGKIGEDLLRGLGNNVLTLRHSVPHLDWLSIGTGPAVLPSFRCSLFLRFMMRKSHSPDKRCPQGRLRRRHTDRQAKNKFRATDFPDLQGLCRAIW